MIEMEAKLGTTPAVADMDATAGEASCRGEQHAYHADSASKVVETKLNVSPMDAEMIPASPAGARTQRFTGAVGNANGFRIKVTRTWITLRLVSQSTGSPVLSLP